jgi:hypothetical protein
MCNRSITLATQVEEILSLNNGIVGLNPAQDLNVCLHFSLLSWVSRSFVMGYPLKESPNV